MHGEGILPAQWIRKALEAEIVSAGDDAVPPASVQPASLDLRLGRWAYRLQCSFLPEDHTVGEKLAVYEMGRLDLRRGAVLEQNRPYLIPLQEELRLPAGLRARANPRSSTGRLDVFTRVITDRSHRFDEIEAGYRGRLWLEVVSRSFTIKVREGLSLNQLRLIAGRARQSDEELLASYRKRPLLFRDGEPLSPERVSLADGLFLSLDLKGDRDGRVGYRARKNSLLLDLSAAAANDPEDFWEPVWGDGGRLVLEPEEFYLLVSREGVVIPPEFAAEMIAYDPTSGELRTHYAGFFDPGFGFDPSGALEGTRAVLEVRAHDVPFVVEHGQRVCKLAFERMLESPDVLYGADLGSSYQTQGLNLSKHFRPWGRRGRLF